MLCRINQKACRLGTVIHGVNVIVISMISHSLGESNQILAPLLSASVNLCALFLALVFGYRGRYKDAKRLFKFSLIQLPLNLSVYVANSVLIRQKLSQMFVEQSMIEYSE